MSGYVHDRIGEPSPPPMEVYRAFTDGSCLVHGSKCGGAAVTLITRSLVGTRTMHECNTTAQRMELEAVAMAFEMVGVNGAIHITTDSQYAYHATLGDWHVTENLPLIRRIHRLASQRRWQIEWKPRNSTPEMKDTDLLSKKAASSCQGG